MRFFIVDDDVGDLVRIRQLLGGLYPDSEIWPMENIVFDDWSLVAEVIRRETSGDSDWVILLDLALGPRRSAVQAGSEEAYEVRLLRPAATLIAYTQFADLAVARPRHRETFDDQINKQRLFGMSKVEGEAYVRQVISTARRRRAGSQLPSYMVKDSLGMRLMAAAFSQDVLDALAEDITRGWDHVEVEALTAGHSGTFLLRFSGRVSGGSQKIVVKCARDRQMLVKETKRPEAVFGGLGPLNGHLAEIDPEIRELSGNAGYYYRQSHVTGESLLYWLEREGWSAAAKGFLEGVVALERRCYTVPAGESYAELLASEMFSLLALDVERARQSLQFLGEVAACIRRHDSWPEEVGSVEDIVIKVRRLLENWEGIISAEAPLLSIAQHGDLNPRNVLMAQPGDVVLIDFSRLGRWPVGYDLSRLAVLLRFGLTDREGQGDWVVNRVGSWVQEKFCMIEDEVEVATSQCPPALYCDQEFRSFLKGRNEIDGRRIARGYRLGALWDLTKVLSYSDLSPFKRVWALIECYRLSSQLDLRGPGE